MEKQICHLSLSFNGWYFGFVQGPFPSKANALYNAKKQGYTHYTDRKALSTIKLIPAKYG